MSHPGRTPVARAGAAPAARVRAPWSLLAALGLVAATAGVSRAAGDEWARLRVPATLRAGETVVLSLGRAPEGIDELEILLSVDGGRTFPVRVSRELGPEARRVVWRVPNLPAVAALMRVRYRLHGRELDGPAGGAFAILGAAGRSQELDLFHEGNWWEGFEAHRPVAPASLAGDDVPSLEAGAGSRAALIPPDAAVPAPPAEHPQSAARPQSSPLQPPTLHTPPERFSPLRN